MACLVARPSSARQICSSSRSRRRQQVRASCSSYQNPYNVLGVSATADETEIKKAYRSKAKQFHPDVSKHEGSEIVFLQLTEAYEFLLNRMRGGRDTRDSGSGDWDFHDWYWNFRINRTWRQQQQGHEAPPSASAQQQTGSKPNIREQLAGLRHRAAIRATKARHMSASMSTMDTCSTIDEDEEGQQHAVHPAWAASVSISPAKSMEAEPGGGSCHAEPSKASFQVPHSTAGPDPAMCQSAAAEPEEQEEGAGCQAATEEPVDPFSAGVPPPRRKFTAHSGTRDAVRHQLAGLRRKSMIVRDSA